MTPLADLLLRWYNTHHRVLPWRAPLHELADPYQVWISEIMLQQTTVTAVIPYFNRFMDRFPTIVDLANASLEEVMTLWSGLGYYSRARNLHACAQYVAERAAFPSEREALLRLPGIGPYTAAAISALAFGQPVIPIDGNVERITARLYAIEMPLPAAKKHIWDKADYLNADSLQAITYPGDFAQALFDLGATICVPKNPLCLTCPLSSLCEGRKKGLAAQLPMRAPKVEKPVRRGYAYIAQDKAGNVAIVQRPPKGLLGGTYFFPVSEWKVSAAPNMLEQAPFFLPWEERGVVKHVFTHFTLYLHIMYAHCDNLQKMNMNQMEVLSAEQLFHRPLTTLMRKCMAASGMVEKL